MIKKTLAILAALALASCNNVASDGYTFEEGSKLLPSKEIKVIIHKSMSDLRSAFSSTNAKPVSENRELQAFTVIGATTCTIHVVDPAVVYSPEFVGHELVHCLYGEFHPSQNS